jgi:hypothetical protein
MARMEVHRAERSRSLAEAEYPAAEAHEAANGHAPAPDLDALAQQVYAVLKRRLAVERRRLG